MWKPDRSATPLWTFNQAVLTDEQRAEKPKPPCTQRPSLDCIESTQSRGDESCLFPSSPVWYRDPEGFFTFLGQRIPTFLISDAQQRRIDVSWNALNELKTRAGKKTKLTAEEWIPQVEGCGYIVDGIEWPANTPTNLPNFLNKCDLNYDPNLDLSTFAVLIRCFHCKRIIDLPEPPECICGTPFCSVQCFKAGKKAHASNCMSYLENNELGAKMTHTYWALVLQGKAWYPYAEQQQKVVNAKSLEELARGRLGPLRNFQAEFNGAPNSRAELDFYFEHEKEYLRERMEEVQKQAQQAIMKEAGIKNLDKAIKKLSKNRLDELQQPIYDELVYQLQVIGTPHPTDSTQRLLFKLVMMKVYDTIGHHLEDEISMHRNKIAASLKERSSEMTREKENGEQHIQPPIIPSPTTCTPQLNFNPTITTPPTVQKVAQPGQNKVVEEIF
eukprot:PhF_6_TR20013/c0_g2_i1/m.29226